MKVLTVHRNLGADMGLNKIMGEAIATPKAHRSAIRVMMWHTNLFV